MSKYERIVNWVCLGQVNDKRKDQVSWLIIILLCLTAITALWSIQGKVQPGELVSDTLRYYDAAVNIFEGREFSFFPSHPKYAYGLPGYPAFIAFVSLFRGSVDPNSVILAQIFLHALIIILTYLTARMFCGRWVGVVSAFIIAWLPNLFSYHLVLLSESLSITIFALAFYLLMLAVSKDKVWLYMVAGLAFGALLYVKQAFQLPVCVVALYLLFFSKKGLFRRILVPSVLVLAMFLAITPWVIRNEQIFGKYSLTLSTNMGNVMGEANMPIDIFYGQYWEEKQPKIKALIEDGKYAEAEILDDLFKYEIVARYVTANIDELFEFIPYKFMHNLRPYPGNRLFDIPILIFIPWTVFYTVIFFAFIVALRFRPESRYLWINLIFIICLHLFQLTNFATLRFRLSWELNLVLIAGCGLAKVIKVVLEKEKDTLTGDSIDSREEKRK